MERSNKKTTTSDHAGLCAVSWSRGCGSAGVNDLMECVSRYGEHNPDTKTSTPGDPHTHRGRGGNAHSHEDHSGAGQDPWEFLTITIGGGGDLGPWNLYIYIFINKIVHLTMG